MREGVIPHEPHAQGRRPFCFACVATGMGTLNQLKHEIGEHHHAFGCLYQAAAHLSGRGVGYVFMLGNQRNLLVGQVAVV